MLTAIVSIAPAYPTTTPVFCISLQQLDSNTETQETCERMRELEREVNLGWGEQTMDNDSLLLVMLDVILEVKSSMEEGEGGTSSTFIKTQVFFDTVKGKMRRLPLLYNSSQQLFQQSYFGPDCNLNIIKIKPSNFLRWIKTKI